MFSDFFAAIRVVYVASQITARHTRPKGPPLPYHHPLEQTIFDALNGSTSGGFVHWGVYVALYESGKSTVVREVAWRLQEEAGRQVIVLQGYGSFFQKPVSKWLRRVIGVPADTHEPLSKFLSKPAATLVIDHANLLMLDKDDRAAETLELVRALIKESEETKKFNVLLVVNSWERAKELVDAGCTLVPGDAPARWTREQLESLIATASDPVIHKAGEKKDELLRFATLSGTPGYLTFEAHSTRISSKHAVMHDLEWRMGTRALYEGSAHCMEGRFPDRNGIYHHADLASLSVEALQSE